jgi:hypothetical protein
MQAQSEPSTAPHFVRGDKVTVVTKNLFLRGQPNRKMRNREMGPFTIEEQIRKLSYKFKLRAIHRLHPVFHVNNLRPCSTTSLRLDNLVTTPKGDNDEFEVSHVSVVFINTLPGRRDTYLLFITQVNDDNIPLVWHRLSEIHRTTALQDFL